MFSRDRLRILRRFHNLTQRELAESAGTSASAITTYELGRVEPKGVALDALCAVLRVKPDYFHPTRRDDEFIEPETNFRSLTSTPDRLRKQMLAHATLFGVVLDYLSSVVVIPRLKLPSIRVNTLAEIEAAAEKCRVDLGVGVEAPIESVTHMVELAGVVVTTLDTNVSEQVDAFSRYGRHSLIVLNPAKRSAARKRFDLAHEIAHGVAHREGIPMELREREEQADAFASALLLPRRPFSREFFALGPSPSWPALFDLKERWGCSVAAIIVRAYRLGLINAAEYQRRYKSMAKQGWLKGGEPADIDGEQEQLFKLALTRFQDQTHRSTFDMCRELHWSPALFREITGLEVVGGDGQRELSPFEEYRLKKLASG